MKLLVNIVFLLLLVVAGNTYAQDAGMSDVETVVADESGDRMVFAPGETEAHYIPRVSGVYAPSDSIALQIHDFPMHQAVQRPVEKAGDKQQGAKQEDDSILTFNFLYYIIQKYKLQDIID